jgi:hypothetical protein
VPIVLKSGSLKLVELSGPVKVCIGIALLLSVEKQQLPEETEDKTKAR